MARIELEIKYNSGVKRESRILGVESNLYAISREMEQYKGYAISEINPILGKVFFTNGEEIQVGYIANYQV